MNLAIIKTKSILSSKVFDVDVEISIANGLPAFNIVGLPEKSVKESKERVRAAIINSKFKFPNKRITVNLTPADIPKHGAHYDLAIALAILIASNTIKAEQKLLEKTFFFGELSLNGNIRTPKGLLSCLLNEKHLNQIMFFSDHETIYQQLVHSKQSILANHLIQAIDYLNGETWTCKTKTLNIKNNQKIDYPIDINEVNQQFLAKHALLIAAAGGHHILMFGPPGVGKSMLAERLITLLPPLTYDQAIETMCIYDQSNAQREIKDFFIPPFRCPHHLTSPAALVGGGVPIQPGEISLAHHGVLFLDELSEFQKNSLESLREPIEKGLIHIKRAQDNKKFSCQFQLVAAMNPTNEQQKGKKISQAILDRIDISIELSRLDKKEILLNHNQSNNHQDLNSTTMRSQAQKARKIQYKRQGKLNANINYTQLQEHAQLNQNAEKLVRQSIDQFRLSVRSVHKIIRLARTICDLKEEIIIDQSHIAQAIQLRNQMI